MRHKLACSYQYLSGLCSAKRNHHQPTRTQLRSSLMTSELVISSQTLIDMSLCMVTLRKTATIFIYWECQDDLLLLHLTDRNRSFLNRKMTFLDSSLLQKKLTLSLISISWILIVYEPDATKVFHCSSIKVEATRLLLLN